MERRTRRISRNGRRSPQRASRPPRPACRRSFGAGRLSLAADIYREMVSDSECTKFFGLAGAMVPAGMRQILSDLIRDGDIDILVTTGANLGHDIIQSLGLHHL